jgi:hypothetical protein
VIYTQSRADPRGYLLHSKANEESETEIKRRAAKEAVMAANNNYYKQHQSMDSDGNGRGRAVTV